MMKIRKIRPWRRLAELSQAAVIMGLPFLEIKGESALRFDVPSLRLHFFGISLWMEEFFIVLVAMIFLSLLVILITMLLGRIWCGWLCPQTVIADFTAFIERTTGKGPLHRLSAYTAVLIVSAIVGANLIWYFVSPYDFIPRLLEGSLGSIIWGFWTALTGILFLNFILLRQKFCATVCPYAKLQSTLFDNKTLVVAFDPRRKEECIDCMACVRTCPVGIDIRKGLDMACIHCAECVDRCADIMSPRQKKSLIGYFFGPPGAGGRIVRQSVVLIGVITGAFLMFFLFLLSVRVPIDVIVLPNYSFQPKMGSRGTVINSYIISIRNRGKHDAELRTVVKGIEGSITVVPDRVQHIEAGGSKKFPVYVSVEGPENIREVQEIEIVIESVKDDAVRAKGKANFILPEKK